MTRLSALGAALAVSAVLASPAHVDAAPTVDATPDVVDAVDPAPAPATPAPTTTTTVMVDACGAALTTASASPALEKKEANLLHAAMAAAIRSEASCAARVKSWLEANRCTQAHGIVSSAAFGTKEWPVAWTSEIVERAYRRDAAGESSCIEATLPSVEQSVDVDPALADSLARATKHADPETRDAGWLLLGTLERRARAQGNAALAGALDRRIASELRRRTTAGAGGADGADGVDVLLEAAGNAGCTACVADVERALGAKDPVTRRIAAGALRFVAEPGATARACTVLRSDENARVRSHAAWSLGWSPVDAETRSACLRDAAERDESDAVRTAAARALDQLMTESKTMEDEGA